MLQVRKNLGDPRLGGGDQPAQAGTEGFIGVGVGVFVVGLHLKPPLTIWKVRHVGPARDIGNKGVISSPPH